jgi:hypothetical protein
MTVCPDAISIFADVDNDYVLETNLSSFVVSDIVGESGIFSYKDVDRISSIGSISFDLNNSSGTFSNNDVLHRGMLIGIRLDYDGRQRFVWFGRVSDVALDPEAWGDMNAHITATDWMDNANGIRVKNIQLQTNLKANEALPTLLALTSVPPANQDFAVGSETFSNMFDGANPRTSVFSEMDKLVKSELGYLYLKFRGTTNGETLVFEDSLHRGITHELSSIPDNSYLLAWHGASGTSGILDYHGVGETGHIRVSQLVDAVLPTTFEDVKVVRGENVANSFLINNTLRNTDSSPVILYSLGSPIQISTNNPPLKIEGSFSDPNGGTIIQAFDVTTPAKDTDYKFWSNVSGSVGYGTDLTANLQQAFTYGTNGFYTELINNGPVGWLTQYNVRGYGTYKYNPVALTVDNTESQNALVRKEVQESLTREYSNNLNTSKTFANGVVAINRTPIRVPKVFSFSANDNESNLLAFMFLEQGDKIEIDEISPVHNGKYYIQGIKFKISLGGMIDFDWYVKEADETICQPIAVRTPIVGTSNNIGVLNFGVLPQLSNLPAFSYTFWLQWENASLSPFAIIIGRSSHDGIGRRGNYFSIGTDRKLQFYSYKTPTDGQWTTTGSVLPNAGTWHLIGLTYDNSLDTADPLIYQDGVLIATTENATPAGTSDDDSDIPLYIYSVGALPGSGTYNNSARSLVIKDIRIYDHILTASEMFELAGNENVYNNLQDGLLFQAPYAPTDNINDYINDTIETDDDLVIDVVHRAVGVPYNSHTGTTVNRKLYGVSLDYP